MMAMATASQTAAGLQVAAPDDDMEVMSDFQHGQDDIDIDLDLGGDYPQHHDEDLMLEDARSEAGHNHDESTYPDNDDVMFDDELDPDGMMQDNQDNLTIPDEHLTDASEIGQEDATRLDLVNQATDANDAIDYEIDDEAEQATMDQTLQEVEAEYEQTLDAIAPTSTLQDAQDDVADAAAPVAHDSPSDDQPVLPSDGSPPAIDPAFELDPTSSNDAADTAQNESHRHSLSAPDSPGETHNDQIQPPLPEYSGSPHVAHDVSQDFANPRPHQEEDLYHIHSRPLHPVVVIYHENQISLFPPREEDESQTFFLQDESIAHQSIYELLQACRNVLGDTIGEEDELEMNIAELGLCISEDCTFAPTVSFSQIIDTYTLLIQQDGVHEPDPLYMTLTTKTRFSSRFNQLNAAAIQGKGISQLTFLEQPDDDGSEYPPNDATENEHSEQTQVSVDEQGLQVASNEGNGSEHHGENLADDSMTKSFTTLHEGENRSEYSDEVENRGHGSTSEPHVDIPSENGADHPDTTESEVRVAEEQAATNSEAVATGPESHASKVKGEKEQEDEEEDLIDYSDDEEDADQTNDAEDSRSGPSTGSSTVQGDAAHSPKYPVDTEVENQSAYFEDSTVDLGQFDDEFDEEVDAGTLIGEHGEAADTVQLQEGAEQEQDEDRELEKEFEREFAKEDQTEQNAEVQIKEHIGYDEKYDDSFQPADPHNGLGEHQAGLEFLDDFDDYAAEVEQDQRALQDIHGEEQGFHITEPIEAHGENTADNGHDGDGHEGLDYENNEHGDFDYPEFNDEVAEPEKADALQEDAGNESDSIDYDDDEVESHPEEPADLLHQPSASPPTKRSRDEQEDDYEDLSDGQGSSAGLRKKTRLD